MKYVAGIDSGFYFTKVVIVNDSEIISQSIRKSGARPVAEVAESTLVEACKRAGIKVASIECITATGFGRDDVRIADNVLSDSICLSRGIRQAMAGITTVLDVGAQKCLAIRLSEELKVAKSDKCAGGAGMSFEIVADILGIPLEEMAKYSDDYVEEIEINSTCAIFAESEIISLIHAQKTPKDILHGLYHGIGRRISTLLRMVSFDMNVGIVGGGALHLGLRSSLEKELGCRLIVPENALMLNALGAATAYVDP